MSRSLFTIAQSKTLKVETARQAENLSKTLLFHTTMSYQAKPKCLAHFSPSHKVKLSKWRLLDKWKPFSKPLLYPTMMSYQAKPKYLTRFSPSHKVKLSKWRLLDKWKPLSKLLPYPTTLNYQARLKPLFSAGQQERVGMR